MNVGLYQSAVALGTLERWQDAVAQNLTSSQITGFKRRTVQLTSSPTGELITSASAQGGEAVPSLYPVTRYNISFLQGEIRPTHRELDLAINGQGFFSVRLPDDTVAYTRSGEFFLNNNRTLVNNQGLEVLDADGNPIQLPSSSPPVISKDGSIYQNGAIIGKIGVSAPTQPERLTVLPGGLFLADETVGMKPVEKPLLEQGHLENSNVQPLREMVDLVGISRAYEANQKLIQNRDKLLERALETLA